MKVKIGDTVTNWDSAIQTMRNAGESMRSIDVGIRAAVQSYNAAAITAMTMQGRPHRRYSVVEILGKRPRVKKLRGGKRRRRNWNRLHDLYIDGIAQF